jgi:hypothetical protein
MSEVTKMSALQAASSLYERLKSETSVYAVGVTAKAKLPVLVVYLASKRQGSLVPSEYEGFEVMTAVTGMPSARPARP